jgi:hypothetical protein
MTGQVQDHSPGYKAGLQAYFDFIIAIGNTRLVFIYLLLLLLFSISLKYNTISIDIRIKITTL